MTRLLIFLAGLACGLLVARVRRAVGPLVRCYAGHDYRSNAQ